MANNNRIFYGSQIAQLKPATTGTKYSSWYQPQGVQSVGFTSNLSTEQAFQLGAIDIYAISENTPEVEVAISKALDGTCPLYLMAMGGSAGVGGANVSDFDNAVQLKNKGFAGLAANTVDFRLGIYSDLNSTVNGETNDWVLFSPMYLSSLNYTFPVDGNATEEVTLVGNNKKWRKNNEDLGSMTAAAINKQAPKMVRRQYIDISNSVLPSGKGGLPTGVDVSLYLQNINISANLGREQINELGQLAPYYRYATFPVEVTSEFEIVGQMGDYLEANDFIFASGCDKNYSNLTDFPIKVRVCGSGSSGSDSSFQVYLGSGNKLTSVNYAGGDTGGGNLTITYGFRNYNDFYVKAEGSYANAPTV